MQAVKKKWALFSVSAGLCPNSETFLTLRKKFYMEPKSVLTL